MKRTAIYNARRREQCEADRVADMMAAGNLAELKCSRCSADVLAFKPMHATAVADAEANGFVLEVVCFDCAPPPRAFQGAAGGLVAMNPNGDAIAVVVPGDGSGPKGVGRA